MAEALTFIEWFDKSEAFVRTILGTLVEPEQLEEAVRGARAEFAAMADEIPYADQPRHAMYWSSFGVYQALAIYKALRPHGFDVHQVGRAILAAPSSGPAPKAIPGAPPKMRADAEASQRKAAPNEFVFEIVDGDQDGETDWGMNITSCAVCHAYAKHNAMALVPYMCATDDKMSDAGGQGLRRTGTIGLGAHQCDFRFKAGGEPLRLAPQFPDAIRTEYD